VVGGVLAVLIGGGLHARADPPRLALLGAGVAVAGGLLGALFGGLTRRLFRVVPRVVFAVTFASTLWLFAYVFVLLRYAPVVARAVAFGPSMLGALAYGVCVGAVPPVKVRRGRRR